LLPMTSATRFSACAGAVSARNATAMLVSTASLESHLVIAFPTLHRPIRGSRKPPFGG